RRTGALENGRAFAKARGARHRIQGFADARELVGRYFRQLGQVESMNRYAVRAIFMFEMARFYRTISQSIAGPVISTSLYFIVFGSASGSRMTDIGGVDYAAFICPGVPILSLLNESICNASFGIYMRKFSGTIYEVLSAPI